MPNNPGLNSWWHNSMIQRESVSRCLGRKLHLSPHHLPPLTVSLRGRWGQMVTNLFPVWPATVSEENQEDSGFLSDPDLPWLATHIVTMSIITKLESHTTRGDKSVWDEVRQTRSFSSAARLLSNTSAVSLNCRRGWQDAVVNIKELWSCVPCRDVW